MKINARGVILHKNHILLIKRIKREKEYYVFPGGQPEKDEDEIKTCIRELKEETGLDVQPVKLISTVFDNPQTKTVYYLCTIDESYKNQLPELEVRGDEIDKSTKRDFFKPEWIPYERLNTLTIYPKRVIESLHLF